MSEDKTRTKQGFVRSQFLTKEQIDGILKGISEGGREGEVCRAQGTSFTQFLRRVKSEPALFAEYRKADALKHRARRLHSQHERAAGARVESDKP